MSGSMVEVLKTTPRMGRRSMALADIDPKYVSQVRTFTAQKLSKKSLFSSVYNFLNQIQVNFQLQGILLIITCHTYFPNMHTVNNCLSTKSKRFWHQLNGKVTIPFIPSS